LNKNKKILNVETKDKFISVNLGEIYKFNFDNNKLLLLKNRLNSSIYSNKKVLKILFDGGCSGDLRNGLFGATFYYDEENILKIFGNIGPSNTNNTAEYSGLIMSLLLLNILDFPKNELKIKIFGDSELVCKQMNDRYKVKTPHIVLLNMIAKNLLQKINNPITVEHIYRRFNEEADMLGNQAKLLRSNSFELYHF
jgi:ribonuclease HI